LRAVAKPGAMICGRTIQRKKYSSDMLASNTRCHFSLKHDDHVSFKIYASLGNTKGN
jgi:hypothetical protein